MPGLARGRARNQPEREWRNTVKRAAEVCGWTILLEIPDNVYRLLFGATEVRDDDGAVVWRGRRGEAREAAEYFAGWPDLLLGKPDRVIAVELKVGKNRQSEHQILKQAMLQACGIPYYLWCDTDDWDAITAILQAEG